MSFKATLIEPQSAPVRRTNIEGFFVLSFFTLLGLYGADILSGEWVVITMVINLIFTYYLISRDLKKKDQQRLKSRTIAIDAKEVIIKTKSSVVQQFELSDVNEIMVKEEYLIESDDLVRLQEEFPYRDIGNFIILKIGAVEHRLDFSIDSHYMIKQLENIIEQWLAKDYNVVYVE